MQSRLLLWLHSVLIARFLLIFLNSIILNVQLSSSQSPHSRKMAIEVTATFPKQGKKNELCQTSVSTSLLKDLCLHLIGSLYLQ